MNRKYRRNHFEGWYLKQWNGEISIAFIPSYHIDATGCLSGSLQIITDSHSYRMGFKTAKVCRRGNRFSIRIGKNVFTEKGCRLCIHRDGLDIEGTLQYGALTPLDYDIMGPLKYIPLLQCRHRIISLRHRVDGGLSFNGKDYNFQDDMGYIEGDAGTSFPESYMWTQYTDECVSIAASAATLPVLGKDAKGCFAVIKIQQKEYRLATYLGAKIMYADRKKLIIKQKSFLFIVSLCSNRGMALNAPVSGKMQRTIHENVGGSVNYRFTHNGKLLLEVTGKNAGYEWEGMTAAF